MHVVVSSRTFGQLCVIISILLFFAQGTTLRRPAEDTAINSSDRIIDVYNATSIRHRIKRSTYRLVDHRDHIIIATFVCDKPGVNLVMLLKTLLYSIVLHKSSSKKVTLMVIYDQILTPQPDVLLCEDDAIGSSLSNEFKSYLSTFNVFVELYPTVVNAFVDNFGRCASSKLWIHDILIDVEVAIVVDVDTLFLENPSHLWDTFFNTTAFNQTVIYGAASEGNQPPYGIYFQNKELWGELGDMRAGPYGVNSGVLLVNLTRARLVNMTSTWLELYNHHPSYSHFQFFDQDLLNIYLHLHPDRFYALPCKWNQRAHLTDIGDTCPDLSLPINGGLIHGNRKIFIRRSYHNFHTAMQKAVQYQRAAFYFYLSSIKNHPLWCMQNSSFSQEDIKIEVGHYGRPRLTWWEDWGFWFRWKGGWYLVLGAIVGVGVSGSILSRLLFLVYRDDIPINISTNIPINVPSSGLTDPPTLIG